MRIIIIGCGRMGAGLAQTLYGRGHTVTVVDRDAAAFERLGPRFSGQTVVGIGFDREILIRAGIERADGLAAVTASDETNVVTARLARIMFRVPRAVARLYDPRKAEIYRRLGVQTISTTAWGIHRIAELLGYSEFDSLLSLGSGAVDLVEVIVPQLLVGRAVSEMTIPSEVHVVAISRAGTTFLPTLGTRFQDGDMVHLSVVATSIERLRALCS